MARLLSCPQSRLPAPLRTEQLRLHRQAWPDTDDAEHDPALEPVTMLLLDGEKVLATLDILSKSIDHRGERYAVSGLSAVVTDAAARGHGYGSRLVAAARTAMASNGRDLGIFTCDLPLAGFYQRAGWRLLPGTILVGGTREHPFPSDQFAAAGAPKVTIGALFSEAARAHAADFDHARIELFPGEIDRLW